MRNVTWEETEQGIVTLDPNHLPLIERFLDARQDATKLRAFCESLGGMWINEGHPDFQPFAQFSDEKTSATAPEPSRAVFQPTRT